jgi:cytoskeletal protein RodZ
MMMDTNQQPSPSLGELLKDARAIKHLSLEDVEVQIKVRLKHLRAIEEGNFDELPLDVFASGFVRRYARLVDVDPELAVSLFRKERIAPKTVSLRTAFSPPQAPRGFPLVVSTKLAVSTLVIIVVLILFGYIWYQVRLFAAPPPLTISSPAENSRLSEIVVTIVGETNPTANLFINNEPVPLDSEGRFRQDVKLTSGLNAIEIKAVSRLGKEAVKTINVLYEETPGEKEPTQ